MLVALAMLPIILWQGWEAVAEARGARARRVPRNSNPPRSMNSRPGAGEQLAATATVAVRTAFELLDSTGVDQLAGTVHDAFLQSLESLRRFVEDKIPWDAR
jgi:hypothetical protein